MDNSSLKRLPPELRLHIYKFTFPQLCPVWIWFNVYKFYNRSKIDCINICEGPPDTFALTQTCEEIKAESLPVFYASNELVIDASNVFCLDKKHSSKLKFVTLKHALNAILAVKPPKLHVSAYIGEYEIADIATFDRELVGLLKECSEYMKLRLSGPCFIKFEIKYECRVPRRLGYDGEVVATVDCRNPAESRRTIIEDIDLAARFHPEDLVALHEICKFIQTL